MNIDSEVHAEIQRAIKKFPMWPTDPIQAASVVAEEAGELVKSANESVYETWKASRDNLRTEAIHTAAMCHRFIMSLDAKQYEFYHDKQHTQCLPCAAATGKEQAK